MAATIRIDLLPEPAPDPVVLTLVPEPAPACVDRRSRDRAVFLRRRLGVLAALILGGLLAFQAAGRVSTAGVGGPAASEGSVYVVQPGDTLWSIANALDPSGDVRETVDRLAELNGGAGLEVGQRLQLP